MYQGRGQNTNSHYLNEKNRIYPNEHDDLWTERDADYNIKPGLLFGETEEITIELQGWKSEE